MPNEFVIGSGFIATNNSTVTGSLTVTGGITGSLFGTSSWASNALTSSYATSVLNGITGTGTTNYFPKFTGISTVGNSLLYDNGTAIGLGLTNPSSGCNFEITSGTGGVLRLSNTTTFGSSNQNMLFGRLDFYSYDSDAPGPKIAGYVGVYSENQFAQNSYLTLGTNTIGSGAEEQFRINSLGQINFKKYISSTSFTGTPAAFLAVDSSGNILTTVGAGSGTVNTISKWTSTTALGNSQITDNGTTVSLGSTVAIGGSTVSSGGNLEVRTSTGGVVRIARDWVAGSVQNFMLGKLEFYNYDADVPGGPPSAGAAIGAYYEDLFGQQTYLTFGTNPTSGVVERMRITAANGNIIMGSPFTDDGTNKLQVNGSGKFTSNVIAASFTGSLFGTASYASNALTASYVNTLNQNVVITGSLTVGSGSVGVGENTLIVGPAPSGGVGEGGQILLSAPGGIYTSASMWDNYQNQTRLLTGTNAGSNAIVATFNMGTKQIQFPAYNSVSAFTGTAVATLAVDSSGNIITTAGGGGGTSVTNQIASGSATASISPITGFVVNTNSTFSGSTLISSSLTVTGSIVATQNITASAVLISGSGVQRLTVIGSGSASPLFTVQGSQGELFTVTDSLSGSLFSVGDISGLPILEVFSDSTTLMGSFVAPALYTTYKILSSAAGVNTIYSLATASYDGVFVDYTIKSGSSARAGTFTAIWSGSSVNYMDNSTTDFGNTTGFVFGANISAGNMIVSGSGTSAGWTVKTIIKAI